MKSNKSFLKKLFDQIQFFAISKKAKKSIFVLGKGLKLPEMQFHEKKSELFDFTRFFPWPTVQPLVHRRGTGNKCDGRNGSTSWTTHYDKLPETKRSSCRGC